MAEPARLEQLTDDLKTPQKASSLFFGPFDTISDPREGSQKPCHLAVQVETPSFSAFVLK